MVTCLSEKCTPDHHIHHAQCTTHAYTGTGKQSASTSFIDVGSVALCTFSFLFFWLRLVCQVESCLTDTGSKYVGEGLPDFYSGTLPFMHARSHHWLAFPFFSFNHQPVARHTQALEARRLVRYVESCLSDAARKNDLRSLEHTVHLLQAEAQAMGGKVGVLFDCMHPCSIGEQ